jgi:hypothetical protein
MRLALLPAMAFALLMAGCSGSLQGPPAFEQTYGTVDEPCAASKTDAVHCTAHVYLINHGGEGVGLATIAVPVTNPTAATASTARRTSAVRCGGYIPDTAGGAVVDLSCGFDLPPGTSVAGAPILQAVNFSAAGAPSSSSGGVLGIVDVGLAAVAGLIAVVALLMAIGRRGRASAYTAQLGATQQESGGKSRRRPDDEDEDW